MTANYFVWYKVATPEDPELELAVRGMQARLACRSGIAGRLMKRRDAPDTWMEVYEAVADTRAFEQAMQSLVDQFDIEVRLPDSRHVECFVETADNVQLGCATKEI